VARKRGRPLKSKRVVWNYKPREFVTSDALEFVVIRFAELEAMRLVDFLGLSLDEAAARMGVSKSTVWRLLRSGRKKVADALVSGKRIIIKEGEDAGRQSA
jgi:excisionase family DNA binding protein